MSVEPGRVIVKRLVSCDLDTGAQQYSAAFEYPLSHLEHSDLGYAGTTHTAQGRTVATSLVLVAGSETRQWFHTAMTRGACENRAIVFTEAANIAVPGPGTRPAPELARRDLIEHERAGAPGSPADEPEMPGTPVREYAAVLADVLAREEDDASATEVLRRELAAADHLAILHAQWEGETRPATVARYEAIVRSAVAETYGDAGFSHRATWLWRTLRAAEAAGLDAGDVARQAAAQGSLSDARDVAAVLDRRIRNITAGLVPQAPRSWSEQVPQLPDPDRQRYVTELAAAMDARRERIGEHLAGHQPAWAIQAFGEVPGHPVNRLDWEQRAATVGAYRELYAFEPPH